MKKHHTANIFYTTVVSGALFGIGYVGFLVQGSETLTYSVPRTTSTQETLEEKFVVTHVPTPPAVKGVYMTSWVAGTSNLRKDIVKLIDDTEINSVVIDIKDYSGKIAIPIEDPDVTKFGGIEERIPDIKEFIGILHDKGIYVIGRVTVFQDPHLTKVRPDLAIKKKSDGSVWKDRKGISYLDPGFQEVWDYHIAIARASYELGFDEINFDYIRFPSDGDMRDIFFPKSENEVIGELGKGKADVIERFFAYLSRNLKGSGIVTSADIFGMTTTNYDDLNIGQVLERTLPHFDYVAPMVYPSHYPPTFIGLANPAEHPYEVIKYSMDKAVGRALAASSTKEKLRPWLQDFNLGADYTAELVRAQITATYDSGLDSFMIWDPANTYTKGALLPFYKGEHATGTKQE
jgi:hypothetical protein